ncbi:MAG: hypothetical protein OXU70_01795 [Gammaproteobacteria bacterium]|nr:hypothetical protein [Gammaproteobacteria bacterium]
MHSWLAFLSYQWRDYRLSVQINHVSSYLDAGGHDGMTHNPKGRRLKLTLRYRLGGD